MPIYGDPRCHYAHALYIGTPTYGPIGWISGSGQLDIHICPYMGILAQNDVFDHISTKTLSLGLVQGLLEVKSKGLSEKIKKF